MVLGAIGGGLAAIIMTPVDVVKTRLMLQVGRARPHSRTRAYTRARTHAHIHTHARTHARTPVRRGTVCTELSVCVCVCTLVCTRQVADPKTGVLPYSGIGHCMAKVAAEEGPGALMKGLVGRVCVYVGAAGC